MTNDAKIQAEFAVIGSLLTESFDPLPPCLSRVLRFAPDSFDDLRLGAIAKAIKYLRLDNKPIGVLTVKDAVNGELSESPDLVQYLTSLCSACGLQIAEYEASVIWDNFRARRLKTVYLDAAAAMESAPNQADSIRSKVSQSLLDLSGAQDANDLFSLQTMNVLDDMTFDDSDRILGDRLLAKGQSLVISGAGSLGKSRLSFQMSCCIIAERNFISFETRGANLRVLILQAENSNRRLQQDIRALKNWLNPYEWDRCNNQILIHTLETDADFFLSLDSARACANIAEAIRRFKPDIIIWDSLYNFAIGDLNSDEDMAATLLTISRLSKEGNAQRSNVVLHHASTGKAGALKTLGYDRTSFSRNSKVLHSWTRGQINLAPGSPDPEEGLLVLSCGKCSNGKEFPPFAIRLNPMSMLYELEPDFRLDAWQDEIQGKTNTISNQEIADLLSTSPLTKKELVAAIKEACGCVRTSAYRFITRAEKAKAIAFNKSKGSYSKSIFS